MPAKASRTRKRSSGGKRSESAPRLRPKQGGNGKSGKAFQTPRENSNLKNGRPSPGRQTSRTSIDEDIWHDIQKGYYDLLDAFYEQEDYAKAERIAARLRPLLRRCDLDQQSILGQELRSLIAELDQDYDRAIMHRLAEIRAIKRLWRMTRHRPADIKGY